MQPTELLHRFFDEGLDESLEDVLFERMAVDSELRREFLQHQKLHHMIQEDVAGITTPSHVSQQLFINLGLTPPANIPASQQSGFGRRIGTAMAGIGSAIVRNRRYVFTAAISAITTALLIVGLSLEDSVLIPEHSSLQTPADNVSPQVTPQQDRETGDGVSDPSGAAVPSPLSFSSSPQSADLPSGMTRAHSRSASPSGTTTIASTASTAGFAAIIDADDGYGAPSSAWIHRGGAPSIRPLMVSQGMAEDREEVLRGMVSRATPVAFEEASGDVPWHFFRPGPRTNLLSNMVFELRKLYGQSYPSVDLPHNSHNLFENMAISAVYKVTDHHAFGFEYGRENFGREYVTAGAPTFAPLDASMQELYTPPSPAMAETVRENRMLDVFGAVWKLSLPEYGMFRFAYPYMRTFVGASLLGPISKVRVGVEMYPSNFSMLNVGLEGGVLRYSVDDATYYTSKLNFTFGVAIGF